MNQIMLWAACRIIVGPTGRRLPAYPDIHAAYTQGLFADYYTYNPQVSIKTCYKYANRTVPFPHFLERHYGTNRGYRRTLSDMMGVVDATPSITLLWQIQSEVHQWILDNSLQNDACCLNANYVETNATRSQIAAYLAGIMHHAVTAESVGNRPTDTGGGL